MAFEQFVGRLVRARALVDGLAQLEALQRGQYLQEQLVVRVARRTVLQQLFDLADQLVVGLGLDQLLLQFLLFYVGILFQFLLLLSIQSILTLMSFSSRLTLRLFSLT